MESGVPAKERLDNLAAAWLTHGPAVSDTTPFMGIPSPRYLSLSARFARQTQSFAGDIHRTWTLTKRTALFFRRNFYLVCLRMGLYGVLSVILFNMLLTCNTRLYECLVGYYLVAPFVERLSNP